MTANSNTKKKTPAINTEELQQQIDTLDQNWKRALADYQNLVKRVETEKKDYMKFVSTNFITKLLPSLDILEMAAVHSNDAGVQMAVKQFQQVLQDEGLQEIVPGTGEVYDHLQHECIEVLPGEDSDRVAQLVTKGYKIDDYVLRPAKVKVFRKETTNG